MRDRWKRPTDCELRNARADFRALLSRATPEHTWQKFFAANPFVLSRSLPLRLEPCDILPLGRPGFSEPDFLIYPGSAVSHPIHGLIELKTPSARIVTQPRKGLLTLTRTAATAVRQLLAYDQEYDKFSPVNRCFSFSSQSHLFVVMGLQQELNELLRDPDLANELKQLFTSNVRLLTFDELLRRYESGLPLRSFVLVPNTSLLNALIGTSQAQSQWREMFDMSFRFVDGLLGDGEPTQLRSLAQQMATSDIKLHLTRQLATAKAHVRSRFSRKPEARYGLIASSHNKLLPQFQLDAGSRVNDGSQMSRWRAADPREPESCCQLSRVATEHEVQGLELDGAVIAWGSDLRRHDAQWLNDSSHTIPRSVRDGLTYRRNVYRVLLTRGLKGSVVFMPPAAELHETWTHLLNSGFSTLDG
jgi:hypothetical protein